MVIYVVIHVVHVDQNVVMQGMTVCSKETSIYFFFFSFPAISFSCFGIRIVLAYRISREVFTYSSSVPF